MIEIDLTLVRNLVSAQFPQWACLPIAPVEVGGWDNRTFHLGERMLVRLPSAHRYASQVEKEQRWLPELGPHLPFPISIPLGLGRPGASYPWYWSVYGWLDGETAQKRRIADLGRFAEDVARFLVALQAIDAMQGPPAGTQNFHRGGSLTVYDPETREAIDMLADELDPAAVTEIWDSALATTWSEPPVWVHGDMAEGNLLVKEGRLCGVIDFGSLGVGDPSSDLVIAWTMLDRDSREIFRAALSLDPATWRRGRGWALWKALITLLQRRDTDPLGAAKTRQVIREILVDHERAKLTD
jgi:aminoglycoside phosphotransferase (APT) family kinase protein